MAKYDILNDDSKTLYGRRVFRIKRVSDGELGGYVEKEDNLSQLGECWIHGDSVVWGDARIRDNAQVFGDAGEHAEILGNATLYGIARGHASIRDNAKVYGTVRGRSVVSNGDVVYGVRG